MASQLPSAAVDKFIRELRTTDRDTRPIDFSPRSVVARNQESNSREVPLWEPTTTTPMRALLPAAEKVREHGALNYPGCADGPFELGVEHAIADPIMSDGISQWDQMGYPNGIKSRKFR